MSKEENKEVTSLSTMLGSGAEFEVKGNKYTVMPIMVAHVDLIHKAGIFLYENQFFNFYEEKNRKTMNKWLGGEKITAKIMGKEVSATYCFDANDEPMSLEKAMADGWDVVDFKKYFRTLCDLSG